MVEEGEGWALQRDWLVGRDLDFRMTVAAFHSGRDEESDPGSAELRLRLANGDLDLELPRFEVGVGSIDGHLRVRSAPEQAETDLSLRIRNLDYTPLTRQLNPEAEEAGRLSLYADLEASSAWGEPVALTARGPLAVLIEPERAESFVLDLWGDDVQRNLFTVLGWASSPSTVNCMAARGTLEAGLMKDLRVLADTTRVRVKGKGKLDVGAQTISLKLRPQPKKRTLLNLSTPVSVRGDLWDPEIRPATGAMVELGFRVVTWAYTVYLQVFKQPLPADDTEACVRLLEGYVDDERWRPGKFLLEPGSLVEEVMDEHSFGDS